MDRINGAGHVNHMFVSEDAAASRPPTEITPEWMNGVQEELVAIIEDDEQALDSGILNQVLCAIKRIFQKRKAVSSAAGGTADALTGTYTPAITALVDRMRLTVVATAANTTAAMTFTPNGPAIAPVGVVKGVGAALVVGDVPGAGYPIDLEYSASLGRWIMMNPAAGLGVTPPAADNSSKIATTAWLYSAMATVMTYFGFSCSLTANGYIRAPSILGGGILQWGGFNVTAGTLKTIPLPVTFPNSNFACVAIIGSSAATASQYVTAFTSLQQISIAINSGNNSGTYFALGS